MLSPSPARSRFVRRAALVAVAGAGAATLVACDKPLPEVTFQSGSRSVLVSPSTYCFTDARSSCRGESDLIGLKAQPNDVVQISVPRVVADRAWIATAYSVDSGTSSPIDGGGTSLIRDNHFGRVTVPNATGSYLLSVTEFRGQTQTGTWTVRVDISD